MFVWYRAIGVRYDCDVLQPEEARRLRKLIHRESRKVGSRDEIATGVPYPWNQTSDPEDLSVFEAVEKQLRGTPYAAGVKGIKKSYEKVTAALKTGRAGRYYPSKFIAFKGHARSAEAEQPR
jgi:hypothetical protein